MRREEGYGHSHHAPDGPRGLWANLGMALVLYGPIIVGAVIGWRLDNVWLAVVVGAFAGALAWFLVLMLCLPVLALKGLRKR